MSGKAKH